VTCDFFCILAFFKYILKNESDHFFKYDFLSRASPIDMTYERVTPCTLAGLGGLARV
jgi:hypothetical protein